jgi:hypothetical protein
MPHTARTFSFSFAEQISETWENEGGQGTIRKEGNLSGV